MKKQNQKGRINAYACSEVEGFCLYADKCRKSETKVQQERERKRERSIICVFVNHLNIFHWKIKYQLNVTKIETS